MNKSIEPKLKYIAIEELHLSPRPHNALRRGGLFTVFDVCQAIENNTISQINNIGVLGLDEIVKKTEQFLSTYDTSLDKVNSPINEDKDRLGSYVPSNINDLPDIRPISDISLGILNNYLGQQTVSNLRSIGISSIADLDKLLRSYVGFLTPSSLLLDKTTELLELQVKKLVDQGTLSPNCFVESTTLSGLLDWKPSDDIDKRSKLQFFKRILEAESLSQEISTIISKLSEREKGIFLDYSLRDLTLEEIGNKQLEPVTRERIRQILTQITSKLRKGLDESLKVYLTSSLEVAKELGESLSKAAWRHSLIEKKILTNADQDFISFDFLCALIKNKQTSQSIFGVPDSVKTTLKDQDSNPIYVINYLASNSNENLRRVKRIVNYTGGIDLQNAEHVLGCKTEEVAGILKTLNMIEIIPGWFSYSGKLELDRSTSLFRAGLIMTQSCGPLSFESFCDGLRRYISRHFDTLAPAEVIRHTLKNFGFKIENNLVTYDGEAEVQLSNSDTLLLELLQEKGPVLSFQDLVEFYLEKGLSFSTATTRVMPDSPIVEKVEYGIYKLRGSEVTLQDLESARARQDDTARNIELIFGSDRIVRFRTNVGTWALGGVLSISRTLPALPDFSEGWPIYVGQEQTGTASRDELLIWGLNATFQKLGVKVGDRVELAIDQHKAKRIVVRIIEDNNT